ncbi:hypothetical protein KR074_001878 [Drosophila pseudoananassae]|nr:hypothetical protein KR074_001878 [Drosophila pseudoananassae]
MIPQYSQEQQQHMLHQQQHNEASLPMTCPLGIQQQQLGNSNLASLPITCDLRNQQQNHESLFQEQPRQQNLQNQQQPMQQQHLQHPIPQQQYYYSQPPMNPQFNSQSRNYNYSNYGYNYWYNTPQQINNMRVVPVNPDLSGIVPPSFYHPGQSQNGLPIASCSGSQNMPGRYDRVGGHQSAMRHFNRIDSYTDFHDKQGLRYRGSEQDLAKYRNIASRTLPLEASEDWYQEQSPKKCKRQKCKNKDRKKNADSSLRAFSSIFLQKLGLFMRFRKNGKQKNQKTTDMISHESDPNSKPKKKGFFKRVFHEMPNHPTMDIYSFSDPKSKNQQIDPPAINDYDQDEVREIENFRKVREKHILKQSRKPVVCKDDYRMSGGTLP